jgi:hypothetical protein
MPKKYVFDLSIRMSIRDNYKNWPWTERTNVYISCINVIPLNSIYSINRIKQFQSIQLIHTPICSATLLDSNDV